MSGLEVLTVVAGVAACISAFADARQLCKDWKSRRDLKKGAATPRNGRRLVRSSRPLPGDDDFDTAIALYSEYIAGYFQMVSVLEGERWLRGDGASQVPCQLATFG